MVTEVVMAAVVVVAVEVVVAMAVLTEIVMVFGAVVATITTTQNTITAFVGVFCDVDYDCNDDFVLPHNSVM